jgi:hypothetical protein
MEHPEVFQVAFLEEELVTAIGVIGFAKDAFNALAEQALNAGDDQGLARYTARAQLADMLHAKLVSFVEIGKPSSGALH